jgi:hypothetical protein
LNLLGKAWNWMGDFHCYVWLKVTQNPEFDGLESLLTGHCMGIFSDTAASWIHILHETPIRPHISPKKSLVSNGSFISQPILRNAPVFSRPPYGRAGPCCKVWQLDCLKDVGEIPSFLIKSCQVPILVTLW